MGRYIPGTEEMRIGMPYARKEDRRARDRRCRERILVQKKEYRERHKAEKRERARARRERQKAGGNIPRSGTAEYQREWRARNRWRLAGYDRSYKRTHREEINARRRAKYKEEAEGGEVRGYSRDRAEQAAKRRERSQAWWLKNRERANKSKRERYAEEVELWKVDSEAYAAHRRRCRVKNARARVRDGKKYTTRMKCRIPDYMKYSKEKNGMMKSGDREGYKLRGAYQMLGYGSRKRRIDRW